MAVATVELKAGHWAEHLVCHLVGQSAVPKAARKVAYLAGKKVVHWADWKVFLLAARSVDSKAGCWAD